MGDGNDVDSDEIKATEDALSALAAPKLTHQEFIDRAYDSILAAKERGHRLEEIHAALPRRMAFGTFESCLSRARFKRRLVAQAGAREQVPPQRSDVAPPRVSVPAPVPVRSAPTPPPAPSSDAATSVAQRVRQLPGAFEVKPDRPRRPITNGGTHNG